MSTSRISKSTVFLATQLLLCGRAWATSGTPTWSLSLVATPDVNHYISTPDLAFDHYGIPSVSYSFASLSFDNSVRHAQMGGLGLWSSRELASGPGVGTRTAIAFDRSERPTVAWVNDTSSVQGQFNYGTTSSIAANGANSLHPIVSLYYDLAGTLRGMYSGASAGNLSSVSYNGSTFGNAAMTSIPGVTSVLDANLVVDHSGMRNIAARTILSAGGQALSLSSETGGGVWTTANFVTADSVDGASLSIDPVSGRLAVAYTTYNSSTNTSKLFYSKFNGGSVATTEILSSASFRYEDVSLEFDRNDDRPAIAYERRTNTGGAQELWYGFLNASSVWQTGVIDATVSMDGPGGAIRAPSLAFDDFNTSWPAVSYIDANGALNVAFDPPATPEPGSIALFGLLAAGLMSRRGPQHHAKRR